MAAPKGHWRKGRSRNLDPAKIAVGRNLAALLKQAIERGWRHPTLGVLSYRVVGKRLKVDARTVHKWCGKINLPPEWALDEIRMLLRDYKS